MTQNSVLPVYSVSGNNYEIGFEIGKRFRPQIVDFLAKSKRLKSLRRVENRNPRLRRLVKYGEKHFPQYMEEIRGIADGSNWSITDILLMNCKYDFPRKGCTTMIFRESDRIILTHNEDNTKDHLDNCHLLKVFPDDGIPFISFCYPGMIAGNSFGFNSCGMIITINAMPTPDMKMGCPRHLIDRSQLEAKNIEDVIRRTLFRERSSGGSFNIVSLEENRAINIETTSQRHCLTEVGNKYLHTNHYVSKELRRLKKDESLLRSSMSRYMVGSTLLSNLEEKTPQAALDILTNLEAKPYSIMRIDKRMRVRTLFITLFDVSNDRITLKVYEPNLKIQEKDVLVELASDDLT